MRFVGPTENMGPHTSSWQRVDQRWTEEPGRPQNRGDSGSGGTLVVVGNEWDVGLWACIGVFIYDGVGVFIYDGSVQTVRHKCDMGGPDWCTERD
jgi:hypothetical protein